MRNGGTVSTTVPATSGALAGAAAPAGLACEREFVEQIRSGNTTIACIIRAALEPGRTTFLTPPDFKQQLGFVVYGAGQEIARHVHRPIQRHIVGTSEVLLVRSGRCEVDLYDDQRERVATRELGPGDIILMTAGGHGFRMLADTVLLEVKQGPYTGLDEKERF